MWRFDVLTLVSLIISITLVGAQSCYWPNGNELNATDNFVSCGDGGVTSQCCAAGHACMSNGLCFNPAVGGVYRGACTDSRWASDVCSSVCNDITDFEGGIAPLSSFPADQDSSAKWYCGKDDNNLFGRPGGSNALIEYPADTTIIKVAGIQATATPSSNGKETVSTAKPASSSATSAGQTTATPSSINVNKDRVPKFMPIAVGIGVGVPLAMLAITLGFFWWKERKRRIIAEKMGFAGNAITMAKQSYEVSIAAVPPALKHSPSRSRMTRQPSKSAMTRSPGRSRGNTT